MQGVSFLSRVPRTRPYLKNREIIIALWRLLLHGTECGRPVEKFEQDFAALYGSAGAVSCSYARMSFYYILKVIALPKGSEIILTPITIHDIINIIILLGYKPVFVDIVPQTYQMDPLDLQRKINQKTKAVLVTHLFGMPSDMKKIVSICKRHDLVLLEDASHSFNAALDGRAVGTFGLAGFFSLSSLKAITSGYGGVIISQDTNLLKEIRKIVESLRNCPQKDLWGVLLKNLIVGMATDPFFFNLFTFPAICLLNSKNPDIVQKMQTDNPVKIRLKDIPEKWVWRFSSMQADLALRCLERVKDCDEKRRRHANILLNELMPVASDRLPLLLDGTHNVFWRFPFRAPERTRFQRFMNKCGIDTTTTLLPCCSMSPAFSEYGVSMPNAERVVQETYFLPVEPALTDNQVLGIAGAVKAFIKAEK